jgi:hypothetical protein
VRLTRTLLAVLATGALFVPLAACGDDDGGSPLSAGTDDNAADDSSGDDSSGDDSSGDDSSGDVDLPDADELEDLADLSGVDEVCLGAVFAASGLGALMSGGEGADEAQQYFDEARSNVPDEIKDDFDVLADFYAEFAALLADFDNDFSKLMSDPDAQEKFAELESDELETASANLDAWFSENCDAE